MHTLRAALSGFQPLRKVSNVSVPADLLENRHYGY